MPDYRRQHSELTLAEGLAEYYAEFEGQLTGRNMTREAVAFFRRHDVVHVIFGCDISLSDELIVKLSSIFGTTAGFGVLAGYRLAESKEIYAGLSHAEILSLMGKTFVLVPRTIWRCVTMASKWPWDDFDRHLDVPLFEIRERFGIRVAHSSGLAA
jgi:ubiquinone biosynthesis protein Coq4